MASNQFAQAYMLLDLYGKLYSKHYGRTPVINKYREKWGMQETIDSLDSVRVKELLEYYFKVNKPGHPLTWFYNNFDRLDQREKELAADARKREELRQRTAERVKESSL